MEPAVSQEANQGKQAITERNSQSPLLRLPREIKDQIYEYVCGGNILHIRFDWGGTYAGLCCSKVTEQAAQTSFDSSQSTCVDEVSYYRHEDCYYNSRTLDLHFLRTCRQIYDEAKLVCYSSNTFYFSDLIYHDNFGALEDFVNTVDWASNVRSIGLYLCSTPDSREFTNQELCCITSKLTGLRCLRLNVHQFKIRCAYNKEAEENSNVTKQILCLRGPFLKAVMVVISDEQHIYLGKDLSRLRWTMAQKQEYANFLRNALLQHGDKEVDIEGDTGS